MDTRYASGTCCKSALWRHDGQQFAGAHHSGSSSRRNLQFGCTKSCQSQFRCAGIYRRNRCGRHVAFARSGTHFGHGKAVSHLSGIDLGIVRQSAGSTTKGDYAFLSAQSVRRGQTIWFLDNEKLPRIVWHVCRERHFVQSRERASRRNVCNAQNNVGCGRHCARTSG